MFTAILDALASLLPPKDAPTRDWSIKLSLLLLYTITLLGFSYFLLKDTELGQRNGLSKIVQTPSQTQYDNIQRRRRIYAAMAKLREQEPNIYAVFTVIPFNGKTQKYDYTDPKNNNRLLIVNSLLRYDLDYYTFNALETQFEAGLKSSQEKYLTAPNECRFLPLSESGKQALKRTLGDKFDSNYYAYGGITDREGHIIAFVMALYYVPPVKPGELLNDFNFQINFSSFRNEVEQIINAPVNAFSTSALLPNNPIPLATVSPLPNRRIEEAGLLDFPKY